MVVISSRNPHGDLGPAWPILGVKIQDLLVLLARPLLLDDARAEDVHPALAALLVDTVG